MISKKQEMALTKPCPQCGGKLEEVGDLADFDHNLVSCQADGCDYVMFYDGSLMHDLPADRIFLSEDDEDPDSMRQVEIPRPPFK